MPTIVFPKGYTQRELFWAGIEAQLEAFLLHSNGNSRWLASPAFTELRKGRLKKKELKKNKLKKNGLKNDGLKIKTANFNPKLVNAFEELLDKTLPSPIWEKNIGKMEALQLQTFTMKQPAEYLILLINQCELDLIEFIEGDPHIKNMVETLSPEKKITLFSSIFLMFEHTFTSPTRFPNDPESRMIQAFFSSILTNFADWRYFAEEIGADKNNFFEILRLQAVLLGTPIEKEDYYAEMIQENHLERKTKESAEIFLDENSKEDVEILLRNITQRYHVPNKCFEINETYNHAKIISHLLKSNAEFLQKINKSLISPVIYEITLKRLWKAIVSDERCPEWLKNNERLYRDILSVPLPLLEYLDSLSDRVLVCLKHNDENSFNEILTILLKELLRKLIVVYGESLKKTSLQHIVEFIKGHLQRLSQLYSREHSLRGKVCAFLIDKANQFFSKENIIQNLDNLDSMLKTYKLEDDFSELILQAWLMQHFPNEETKNIVKDILRLHGATNNTLWSTSIVEFMEKHEESISTDLRKAAKYSEDLNAFVVSLIPSNETEENKTSKKINFSENFWIGSNINEYAVCAILIDIVNKHDAFSRKASLLALLNSDLPFYSKLRFIGTIAKHSPKRLWHRADVYALLFNLENFNNVSPENISAKLKAFLDAQNPDNIRFHNLSHAMEFFVLRAILAQEGLYETFKNLVPFLIKTGIICDLEKFFSYLNSSSLEKEITNCRIYLNCDEIKLSPQQKNIFSAFLDKIDPECDCLRENRVNASTTLVNKSSLWRIPSPITVAGSITPLPGTDPR